MVTAAESCELSLTEGDKGDKVNGLFSSAMYQPSCRPLLSSATWPATASCRFLAHAQARGAMGANRCEGIVPEENSSDRDLEIRIQHQVDHIVSAFAEQATRISRVPDGEGGINHMHAEDHILVREEHVRAVH